MLRAEDIRMFEIYQKQQSSALDGQRYFNNLKELFSVISSIRGTIGWKKVTWKFGAMEKQGFLCYKDIKNNKYITCEDDNYIKTVHILPAK